MKKYCLVGAGNRGIAMFGLALASRYRDFGQLTALCDRNEGRLRYAQAKLGPDIQIYTDFEHMMREADCDVVIVCTQDNYHHAYIIRALELGKDVITEKPMTIDAGKCRAILRAEQQSGRRVQVTFNYRFVPLVRKIKNLLDSNEIGAIHSVEFQWFLDTVHGADYYRRWHREKANSGGLLVHKATHHFDILNWWTGQEPSQVFAYGSRQFYGGRETARGKRCLTCDQIQDCRFYMDMPSSEWDRNLYLNQEHFDHYYRDKCVFDPSIDIEDNMTALIKYHNGLQLTYNLIAYCPFEGWRVTFTGSKGRLEACLTEAFVAEETPEYRQRETPASRRSLDWRTGQPSTADPAVWQDEIRVYPLYGGVRVYQAERSQGGHGGGDDALRDLLFMPDAVDDIGAMAGSHAGAMSLLIGAAANLSIQTNHPVNIAELLALE